MGATSGTALWSILHEDAKWDLATIPYTEWLDFVFQHPVKSNSESEWYWQEEWDYKISNNGVVLDYLVRLFSNSSVLIDTYSEAQLEQGFWFLLGPAGFSDIAWDEKIDLSRRIGMVRAQSSIFRDLFLHHPLDTSVYMWWDLFESGYDGFVPKSEDDAAIQDAILVTLGEILGLDSWPCLGSALHGLNHLGHPRVPEFIDYFLATKQGLDEDIINYALLCREGKAL